LVQEFEELDTRIVPVSMVKGKARIITRCVILRVARVVDGVVLSSSGIVDSLMLSSSGIVNSLVDTRSGVIARNLSRICARHRSDYPRILAGDNPRIFGRDTPGIFSGDDPGVALLKGGTDSFKPLSELHQLNAGVISIST
jgi:hypothetical protein